MALRSFHFRVSGKVQGVFYRQTTADTAASLGLVGYVFNSSAGDVEGVAQGQLNALKEFKQFLFKGPRLARVKDVAFSDERELEQAEYQKFEVRR